MLTLAALFAVGGTAGWLLELVFRRCVHGQWVNPGFLHGPCLPLYGFGLVALYVMCNMESPEYSNPTVSFIMAVLFQTAVLTTIEFITGLIFTKVYHVRLWDYSECFGNIQGIICPLFSLAWAAISAVYMLFVHHRVDTLVQTLLESRDVIFFFGEYFGLLSVDVAHSFRIAERVHRFVDERNLAGCYETLKRELNAHLESVRYR